MTTNTLVKKNSLYLIGAYVLQKIFTLFYFVAIARHFGPHEQGMYSTALAFSGLFAVCIDVGLASVIVRETARDREQGKHFVGETLIVRLMLGGIVYGVMLVSAYIMGVGATLYQLIALAGIATILDMLSTLCWAVFRGMQVLWYEACSIVLVTLIMVGIGGFAIFLQLPLAALLFALLCASISGFGYVLFLLVRKAGVHIQLKPSWPLVVRLFILSLPFAGGAIFSRLYTNSDVVLLARMAGEQYAGWYAAANKIILALQFIPASISASVFPALSAYFISDTSRLTRIYSSATFYLLLLVLPLGVGIAMLARPVIFFFYGNAYEPTIHVLQTLSIALIFAFLIFPLGALLAAIDRQTQSTIIFGCAALLNLVLNVILIPPFTIVGAALASAATYCFIFVACFIYSRSVWMPQWRFLFVSLFKMSIATASMALILWVVGDRVHVLVRIALGGGWYALCALFFGLVSLQDVRNLKKVFTRSFPV